MQGQDVSLGGLMLMSEGHDVDSVDGYTLRVTSEDASLGNAQGVATILFSMLAAGSIVSRDRDDNRQPVLIVEVAADLDDGLALAKGEAALQAVCDRAVELVWRPPQTGAPVAVFDIVDSKLDLIYSDMDELNMVRGYRLTMQALPYARSQDSVVAPAVVGVATLTTVDNADATTLWASSTSVISDIGTAVRSSPPRATDRWIDAYVMGFSGTVLDTRPYVVVEWRTDLASVSAALQLTVEVSGPYAGPRNTTKVAEFPIDADWRRTYFRLNDPVNTFKLVFQIGPFLDATSNSHLDIRDVSATSFLPTIGTGRQQIRLLEVGGSVPTQGSITVEHETTDVGETIIYTRPLEPGEIHMPALSSYATGTSVANTALLSGKEWDITGGIPFSGTIPVPALPAGDYVLMARIKSAVAVAEFENYLKAIVVGSPNQQVRNDYLPLSVTVTPNVWTIVNLGVHTLPPTGLGQNDLIGFIVSGKFGDTDVLKLDEAWLFSLDGALTITTDLTWKRLRVVAPSLDAPAGAVWAADDPAFLNAWSPADKLVSRQHHNLKPGLNHLYTATTGSLDAAVSAEHHNRWNTYPAD